MEKKLGLIKRNTEEVLTEDTLRSLLETGVPLKHYIGFEISGKIHLGNGLMSMMKVRDLLEAGVECNVFLADWHTWINDKLGGDLDVIKRVAVGYFKEGLKASLACVGGDPEKLNFTLGSELYHNNDEFWHTVVEICKNTTLSRMRRSITIAGREEGDSVDFAKLLYSPMQVADLFVQGINLPHAGLDQRKAQVIARDVAGKLEHSPLRDENGDIVKPAALHHHLLLGLGQPPNWPLTKERCQELWAELKMSKSKPDTCVFIHDSPEEIRRKMKKAFCPEGEAGFNPVLDWAENLIFPVKGFIRIEREEKYGGNVEYGCYEDLQSDFLKGELHPMDLKKGMAEALVEILRPAREHFEKPVAKEMLQEMGNLVITR